MANRVILEYGEIISILRLCKLYDIRLTIIFDNSKVTGKISDISEYTLTIKTESELPPNIKSLDLSFELNKEPYHFKGDVVKILSKEVMVLIPSQLEIWAVRKYERSYCYGKVFCNINIIKDLSQDLKNRAFSMPSRLGAIFREVSKDVPDIPSVIKMVQDELNNVSDIGELFLHKQGESLPLPVIILTKYKKPILIENTQEEASYFKKYLGEEAIAFGKFMEDLKWPGEKVDEEIKKFISFFQKSNIKSIIYAPIFLFENVVGHIRVASLLNKTGRSLSLRDVFYVQSLADITSEALAKYKLFSLTSSSEFPLPVHDISVGGLKVEIEQYLAKFLDVGTRVKISIKFDDNRTIVVKGRVLRVETEGSKLFSAIQFEDLDKTDEIVISSFVDKNRG
ncbi:MAG: PilZ domain-containing protein [Brevinematia bacterium]